MRPISHLDTVRSSTAKPATTTSPPTSPPAMTQPRSPWHSPVPYLFGGLAAMLGLIAFALLILACSYWKLSGRLDNESGEGNDNRGDDLEKGGSDSGNPENKVYEEKLLVIMAGNEKPTFLATPVYSKVSSPVAKIDSKEEIDTERVTIGTDQKVKEEEEMIGYSSHDQTSSATEAEEEETGETQQINQQQQQVHEPN